MIDCPLTQRNGKWYCPQCGWTYHKQVRRNCPKAPGTQKQKPKTITRHDIEKILETHVKAGRATQTPEQIAATLDHCFGGCKHFNGSACDRWGSPCKYPERWTERLLLNGCDGVE